jgi:hypothetical protein
MGRLRLAGALWVMAGLTCAGVLSFVFISENIHDLGTLLESPELPTLVLGGAIVALLIGGLLLTRPGPGVVRWSNLAGVAWFITFGPLVMTSVAAALGGYEVGPVVSSSLIAGLGIAGALVAYGSRMTERRLN